MFGGLGMGELVVIFLVVLLLFGAKRLPEIGSSLGKGIREFKGSIREIEREIQTPEKPAGQVTPTAAGDSGGDSSPGSSPDSSEGSSEGDEDPGEPRRLTTSD
jgi:sec-independent protein translocase protein TatA